jgi:hypothetical protein
MTADRTGLRVTDADEALLKVRIAQYRIGGLHQKQQTNTWYSISACATSSQEAFTPSYAVKLACRKHVKCPCDLHNALVPVCDSFGTCYLVY